ncbi:hypothetical protein PHMEG_00013175 [Phytophthora megakarya]|uniref:Uncharacterized protein n=1 Tax=Phytophthora megakarya TaxID=4795 RepID=A0A225W8E1_9STRA|nr:hypothetical protein PHMEG_00013175 [Phytophthora megakarya]
MDSEKIMIQRTLYGLGGIRGNIGEGVDILLDMNFLYSARVRLCIHEGLVKLPDEGNVVMYDDVPRKRRGLELPVCAT